MESASNLATPLGEVFDLQGATTFARLLKSGLAEFQETNFDNWNGGTTTYSFVIRVPVAIFAALGDEQDRAERRILESLQRLLRAETHDFVNEVVVMPDASLRWKQADEPTITDEDHAVWQPDQFRLFASHVSRIKAGMASLKAELAFHGIAGFVAHEDIEPTRDWQDVIEGALRTMDAFAAFVTPDFLNSNWCDQEVGVAVGRGKLVVPVRLGADPHGFLARYQGIQGKGLTAPQMAQRLFDTLSKNENTARRLAEATLKRLEYANSFAQAKAIMSTLERFDQIPPELLRAVEPALETNVDLREAFGVRDRFRKLMARNKVQTHTAAQ